jgi:hypothetical protein
VPPEYREVFFMRIPQTLKIGAYNWTVQEDADVVAEGGVYGSTHFRTQKIFLAPDISVENKAETLLHELLHTAIYYSGLKERLPSSISDEEIVASISPLLYQIITDNKLVF